MTNDRFIKTSLVDDYYHFTKPVKISGWPQASSTRSVQTELS